MASSNLLINAVRIGFCPAQPQAGPGVVKVPAALPFFLLSFPILCTQRTIVN